jgi:hypothetical protein
MLWMRPSILMRVQMGGPRSAGIRETANSQLKKEQKMVEQSPTPQNPGKCGRATCKCGVRPGELYCSDYCERASFRHDGGDQSRAREEKCQCEHPDCR